jgi:AcrR family transcriptional regulator
MTTPDRRALRSDARQNYDRLLEAAARAFAREGADTSLKAIAKEAEVGIGTLYRRFPTRDDLIEATYRDQTARLCQRSAELVAELPAGEALRRWMDCFVDYMNTKRGMAEALPGILAAREGLRRGSRELLRDALRTLLDAGLADGSLRPGVPAEDVMMALGGITLISGHEHDPELASRLLDLLMEGMRAHPA